LKNEISKLFKTKRNAHVLYSFYDTEQYIDQLLNYIQDGIEAGEYIILIENTRTYPIIQEKLSHFFSDEQLQLVHYVNSLDFYWSSGSYHPPAITEYFNKTLQPYVEKNISFRSWAHVEWASIEEPLHLIKDFEEVVDEAVNRLSFPLICAYEGKKMPEHIKNMLLETHPYVLVEDHITLSDQYGSSESVSR